MRITTLLLAVLFSWMSLAQAQESPFAAQELKPLASQALATFTKIVNKENYMQMGFETIEEIKMAELGTPLQEFMVRLDRLQKYEPGGDPNALLDGGQIVFYPVNVKQEPRSAIMLAKSEDQWKPVSYGSANLIRRLAGTRERLQSATDMSGASFFAVRIPALNLYFLGHRVEKQLMLTPIVDHPHFKFKAGTPVSADEVFRTILPAAKSHNGLPT